MVSLTLWPLAPWHAAHTVAALALPASRSAACANGAMARTTDNPSIFFMGLLLCTRTQGYTSNPARTMGAVHLSFSYSPCNTHRESSTRGSPHDDTPDACTLSGRRHRARRRPGDRKSTRLNSSH